MALLECLKSVGKILHENNHLWSMMKKSSVSRGQRFTYSQILFLSWKDDSEPKIKYCLGTAVGLVQRYSSQYRTLDTVDEEPMEFEWNIFPGFTTLQVVYKVQKLMNKMGEPEQLPGRINLHVDVQKTSHGKLQTLKSNVLLIPHLLLFSKIFQQGVGRSSDLDKQQSGILLTTKDHKENGRCVLM